MKRVWINSPEGNVNYQYEINDTNNKLTIDVDLAQKNVEIKSGIYNIYRLAEEVKKVGVDASVGENKDGLNKMFLVLNFNDSFTMITGSLIDFLGGIESVDSGDRINVTDLR